MKDIKTYINESDYNIFEDIMVNESLAPLLPLVMVQISMLIMMTSKNYVTNSGRYSGYEPSILDQIKSWWKDKKAAKIIKKLALDDEIQKFLQQSPSKQQSGWRDLLKSKLDENELEYITRITKNKVSTEINK